MKKSNIAKGVLIAGYFIFIIASIAVQFLPGEKIAEHFASFSLDMLKIVPCVFILIGLFEVWVKKETVEKHLGENSFFLGYLWAILMAGATVGGLYVAFPVAYSLYNKGARLSIIFTYIGAAALCRIPMTVFEATFMGIKFTLIRLIVSIPMVIFTAIVLEKYLKNRNYAIKEGKQPDT